MSSHLVGRLGARAPLDEWVKDAAPSTTLRTWYGHDPDKFEEFRRRYAVELAGPAQRAALAHLRTLAGAGKPLTLLTATKDVAHSQAAILAALLRQEPQAGEPACYAHLVCPECGAVLTEPHAPGCPHAP
jgi:uncharacterized protein YeaO (DUF488 family)